MPDLHGSTLPEAATMSRARRRLLQAAAGLACSPAWAQASASRVALVIGNAAYPSAPLLNPTRDARVMAQTLGRLGFEVVLVEDGSRAAMLQSIARAQALLQGRQGIGLLFYAGHGLQLDWRNYLLPVDALPTTAAEVPRLSVDTQAVVDAFRSAGTRMNILVLDACRDNPFGGTVSARGLAPMDAPPGTYMAYATAPGNLAEDGSAEDGHGLYTRYLLREMQRPDARIEDVFKRVRLQVRKASQGRQVPWDSSSLEEDFVFATGQQVAEAGRREREAALAAQKADWDHVKDSERAEDLYAFLERHPTGAVAELAIARLERLQRARIQPQADRQGERQDPVATRFRVGDRYVFAVLDGRTGQERRRMHVQVTRVAGEVAEYTGLRNDDTVSASTLAGAVISDGLGRYDPPYTLIPGGEFQLGKRWSGRSDRVTVDGRRGWIDYSGRIVARERVEVPGGSFDTWRVEMTVLTEAGESQQRWLWMQPDWGVPLKLRIETRRPDAGVEIFRRELVSRERGG